MPMILKHACGSAQLAYDFRQRFKRDVVIDLIGYRRQGHNEADDPSYTQPVMYRKIKATPTVATQYSERLVREKLLAQDYVDNLREASRRRILTRHTMKRRRIASSSSSKSLQKPRLNRSISRFRRPRQITKHSLRVIEKCTTLPDDFHLHPKLKCCSINAATCCRVRLSIGALLKRWPSEAWFSKARRFA